MDKQKIGELPAEQIPGTGALALIFNRCRCGDEDEIIIRRKKS